MYGFGMSTGILQQIVPRSLKPETGYVFSLIKYDLFPTRAAIKRFVNSDFGYIQVCFMFRFDKVTMLDAQVNGSLECKCVFI